MDINLFLDEVRGYQSEHVFNPYLDVCNLYDVVDAPQIRLSNLSKVLDFAMSAGVDSLWIGRDLGYLGGRRTGIALTDEHHLRTASDFWNVELKKSTNNEIAKERTATLIWQVLDKVQENIFMWNVFPFHPYEADNPFSNRLHTAKERDIGIAILEKLVALIKPKRIVAIGNDAYRCSNKVFPNMKVHKVRHPSYGGEKQFNQQMQDLYQSQ